MHGILCLFSCTVIGHTEAKVEEWGVSHTLLLLQENQGGQAAAVEILNRRINKSQLMFIMMCALATIPASRILHKDIYHSYCTIQLVTC